MAGKTAIPPEPLFAVENLHAQPHSESLASTEIISGVDLVVGSGEVHALMGPNGSGKTTFAGVLMGNPGFTTTQGRIVFKGSDITDLAPDARAKMGLYLGFQYPEEIPGVPMVQFMRQALSARRQAELSVLELRVSMMEWLTRLGMDPSFADRYVNEGYSGGEKKRNEVLQMALLEPDMAVLDETDSGLDIDGLKIVTRGIQEVRAVRPHMGVLLITHYRRLLDHISPDKVHVLMNGRIVETGGPELASLLDTEGYERWRT